MVKAAIVFRASGSEFSPGTAERSARVSFSRKNERDDIGTVGRYRGQPLPYGSGELFGPETGADLLVPDVSFFSTVEQLMPACVAAGATLMILHIDVAFIDQCNIELSPALISVLARLGVSVTMSCFEES